MKTTLLVFLVLFCGAMGNAKIIKVPQDYAAIQLAINAAVNGDTVLVAEGAYSENLKITKKITLGSLYLMDGDKSHISKTIIDGGTPSKPDSASVILILPGTDSATVVKGLTIQNGRGTYVVYPTIVQGFDSLRYRVGGGITIIADGGATISTNVIKNNSCTNTHPLGFAGAGGIAIYPDVNLALGPGAWVIEKNIITNNSSVSTQESDGGGLTVTGRGRVSYNTITHNTATGGLAGEGSGIVVYPTLGQQNVEISNNLIEFNSSSGNGGGVVMWPNALGSPVVTLRNNIIANNTSAIVGGAFGMKGGVCTFINNTIANNTGPNAFWISDLYGTPNVRLMNNIIWNPNSTVEFNTTTWVSSSDNCVRGGLIGFGNSSADPLFVANDSLYRISPGSLCISAGAMNTTVGGSALSAPSLDFLGLNRPRPSNTNPDLGAIESDFFTTDVNELAAGGTPAYFALSQNYPNPFNPTTVISYQLAVTSHVTVKMFDILGREVATLVNEEKPAGSYSVQWNAEEIAGGMYSYKLEARQKEGGQAGSFSQTRKLLLLK